LNILRVGSWLVISLICAALLPLTVAAQDIDLPGTFTFESGTSVRLPDGVKTEQHEDLPHILSVSSGDSWFFVVDFTFFQVARFTAESTLEEAAAWYIETFAEVEFDADKAEAIAIDSREALAYTYEVEDTEMEIRLVMVRFTDGSFGALDAWGVAEDDILSIAATFDAPAAPARGGLIGAAAPASAASCTIRTADANTVQLRVGPGTNRTVFAFLPANTDFTPLGRAEADDGSLWFQLDRAEVAPRAAAAEAWVAAEEVESSGNCDALDDAAAPPIVPIIPAAPPASGSAGSGDSAPAPQGSVVPSPGTWTLRYAATGKASCLGTQTIDFPVSLPNETVSLSVSGNSIIFGGDRLTQVQPGVYSGLFDFSDGSSVRLVLRAASSTLFTGEAIANVNIEGEQCSATIPLTVTRN
jgi:hypothetical protein